MPLFNFAGLSLMGSGLYIESDDQFFPSPASLTSPVRDLNLESPVIPLDSPAGALLSPVGVSGAFNDDGK